MSSGHRPPRQSRAEHAPRPPRAPRPARAGSRTGRSATAARMPFVILVVALLAGGLISLLLLNGAVNQDSFELNKLQKETTGYTDEQQQLQQEVDQYAAPGSLERRARELGMVPGGNPAFLDPDGGVHGTAQEATAPPAPPPASKSPPPAGKPSTTPTGTPPAGTPPTGARTPGTPPSTSPGR